MSFLIHQRQDRTRVHTITLVDDDGTAYELNEDDDVHVKIYRQGQAAALEVSSVSDSDNGSAVNFTDGASSVSLRIAQADAAELLAGAYECEVVVAEDGEVVGGEVLAKHVAIGSLFVQPAGPGSVSNEEGESSS